MWRLSFPSPMCASDSFLGYLGLNESNTLVTLWCAWQHPKISQKAKLLLLTVEPTHSAWLTVSKPSLPWPWSLLESSLYYCLIWGWCGNQEDFYFKCNPVLFRAQAISEGYLGTSRKIQWVKVCASKPGHLSLSLRILMMEGESQLSEIVFCEFYTMAYMPCSLNIQG